MSSAPLAACLLFTPIFGFASSIILNMGSPGASCQAGTCEPATVPDTLGPGNSVDSTAFSFIYIAADNDWYEITGSYGAANQASGDTAIQFNVTAKYVGLGGVNGIPSVGSDTFTLTDLQDYDLASSTYFDLYGTLNGTYSESTSSGIAGPPGSSWRAQLFYNGQPLPVLGPFTAPGYESNAPGTALTAFGRASTLDAVYVLTYDFAKGSAAGSGFIGTNTIPPVKTPPPYTNAPSVSATVPANGAIGVPVIAALSATFNEAVDPKSVTTTTFTLNRGTTPIGGTVTYSGVTATFTPFAALAPNTLFTATVTKGVVNAAGAALPANFVWSFTTAANPTPALISTFPLNDATLVTTSANLVGKFSQLLTPLAMNTIHFTLLRGSTPVVGTVTYAGAFATFSPATNLAPYTQYNASLTSPGTNPAAGSPTATYSWSFTTGSSADQAAVCLSNFAVLSGSSIVSSGPTAITGDIGVSSGSAVTGFPPGTITGTIHAGDAAAAQGIVDLSAAYTGAVSRSVGPVSVAGDLGGQTFTAGLYNSTSSLTITSGALTLDAKGDPNAVFIFQMAGTLTTAPGSQVILLGGAKAFNVFWQVGASASLGAGSVLNGSILADQSITLETAATVNGRLLAQNGTVTLQSSIVSSPPPNISVGGIVNAANDSGVIAAGSIVSVFGNNLGSSLMTATGYPLPTTLGGSGFQAGVEAAPLYMTSCGQVNLQIPWDAVGQVPVSATVGGLVSTVDTITIAPLGPAIFSLNQVGSGQGAVEIAPSSQLAAPLGPASRPVAPGEYIAIFSTGLGPVSNQPATGAAALSDPLSATLTMPTVTIGGAAAEVTYSGLAPGFAGLYQVNAIVPGAAPSGDAVSLAIAIGGVQSNVVTIAVQ